jgi:hypothetical protein
MDARASKKYLQTYRQTYRHLSKCPRYCGSNTPKFSEMTVVAFTKSRRHYGVRKGWPGSLSSCSTQGSQSQKRDEPASLAFPVECRFSRMWRTESQILWYTLVKLSRCLAIRTDLRSTTLATGESTLFASDPPAEKSRCSCSGAIDLFTFRVHFDIGH